MVEVTVWCYLLENSFRCDNWNIDSGSVINTKGCLIWGGALIKENLIVTVD